MAMTYNYMYVAMIFWQVIVLSLYGLNKDRSIRHIKFPQDCPRSLTGSVLRLSPRFHSVFNSGGTPINVFKELNGSCDFSSRDIPRQCIDFLYTAIFILYDPRSRLNICLYPREELSVQSHMVETC